MNAIRPLVITATVFAAALTLTAAPSQSASNLACKPMVWAQGFAAGKRDAKAAAARNWAATVSRRYGRAYTIGSNTINGSFKCARTGGNWRCGLGARPCKASFQGFKAYEKPPRSSNRRRTR